MHLIKKKKEPYLRSYKISVKKPLVKLFVNAKKHQSHHRSLEAAEMRLRNVQPEGCIAWFFSNTFLKEHFL